MDWENILIRYKNGYKEEIAFTPEPIAIFIKNEYDKRSGHDTPEEMKKTFREILNRTREPELRKKLQILVDEVDDD